MGKISPGATVTSRLVLVDCTAFPCAKVAGEYIASPAKNVKNAKIIMM
jgi:hypothetical protein